MGTLSIHRYISDLTELNFTSSDIRCCNHRHNPGDTERHDDLVAVAITSNRDNAGGTHDGTGGSGYNGAGDTGGSNSDHR